MNTKKDFAYWCSELGKKEKTPKELWDELTLEEKILIAQEIKALTDKATEFDIQTFNE